MPNNILFIFFNSVKIEIIIVLMIKIRVELTCTMFIISQALR